MSHNLLSSHDWFSDHTIRYLSHAIVYSRAITPNNDLGFSFSLFDLKASLSGGMLRMRYAVDFRHRFSSVPFLFAGSSHASIRGYVFRDDAAEGRYEPGMAGLPEVEIVLDGERRIRTNEKGFYWFNRVPAGPHRVEAVPRIAQPYFFTTSSTAQVEAGSAVNFGIAMSSSQVFGIVHNDAGEPVADVTVLLEHSGQRFTARTGGDGHFSITTLPEGEYSASLETDSVPPGYWLQGIKKQVVATRPGVPGKVEFSLKANRVLSGRVLAYDRQKGREVPVPGVKVRLQEIRCQVVSNRDGSYRFKDMPAGTYTITTEYQGRESNASAVVPTSAGVVRDVNLYVGTK